jgi:uncharacterized membrane protein
MIMARSWNACLVMVAAVATSTPGGALAGTTYTVTDLGALPGFPDTRPVRLNSAGIVVGISLDAGQTTSVPFRWQAGAMTSLPGLESPFGSASGINDQGVIVGQSALAGLQPVRWDSGVITALPRLPGGTGFNAGATAVSESGVIVGFSSYAGGGLFHVHAAQWFGGAVYDLGALPGDASSLAWAVNESGQAVGRSGPAINQPRRAVLWEDGIPTDLGVLPGDSVSNALEINDLGDAVGVSGEWVASLSMVVGRPTLWDDLGPLSLPLLAGHTNGLATGINDAGAAVGQSFVYEAGCGISDPRAVLWESGSALDLNSLIDPGTPGWLLTEAMRINDRGQIIGRGVFDGQFRAFLATPIPEPSSICAMLVITACAFRSHRSR